MIKIKNWDKFQHFKDRNPPWIKLHRSMMDQRDINMISDCSFRILINLWLLASEDINKEGSLPEIADIAFRLRKTEKEINKALEELSDFLIQDDINVISSRYQHGPPETETETYREETETESFVDFDEIATAIKLWNDLCKKISLPQCQKITAARKAATRARLKECNGIEGWKAMLEIVENNPFFHGDNDRGWKANIDFVLKEGKFAKIMEGSYNHQKGNGNGKPTYHERLEAAGDRGVAKVMADWEARNPCPGEATEITDQSEL